MPRYIDADALRESYGESIEECRKWADEMRESGNEEMVIRAEQSLGTFVECSLRVKNAPTIDAVPVVRCKDCKHWKTHSQVCSNDDLYLGIHDCGCYPDFSTNPDWFCAYGERKDA